MGVIKEVVDFFRPNPLDAMLEHVKRKNERRLLLVWNRGLGDIALGLYAMVYRIKELIPEADITFLTRPDLKDGFELLGDVHVLVGQSWERGGVIDIDSTLSAHEKSREDFDLIIEKPDPTRWTKWQVDELVPKLTWKAKWDQLIEPFKLSPDREYIGVHLQTETDNFYGYEKNWPLKSWYELCKHLTEEKNKKVILFGLTSEPAFEMDGVVDLRGKTNLFEMLSIVKNSLSCLIVPDSGILSIAYYLDVNFPLKLISLWSDPRQGVLKQNVSSPNRELVHIPLIGRDECVKNICIKKVLQAIEC